MKRLLLYIIFASIGINVSAEINPWGLISQGETSWNPKTPATPIKLNIVPVDSVTCNAKGMDLRNFTALSGKFTRNPLDDAVSVYLHGKASNGASISIKGKVGASSDSCLVIIGTLYGEGIYGNVETSVAIALENAEKAEKAKRDEQEKLRKENAVKDLLAKLMNEKRVRIKEKKKMNFGSALSSIANGQGDVIRNSIDKNQILEVSKPDGEAISGQFSNLHLTLTLKSGQTIGVDFAGKMKSKLVQQDVDFLAWYSENIGEVLYLYINKENYNAFLYSNDKIFMLDTNTIQSLPKQ